MVGPMGRNVDDLTYITRATLEGAQRPRKEFHFKGEQLLPIPWREVQLPVRLKIGYMTESGAVKVTISIVPHSS